MQIAILLYDGFTALDAVGPYEVLVSLPDTQVHFVAETAGPVQTDTKALTIVATANLDDIPHPDMLVIPGGGEGTMQAAQNKRILDWVRSAHATARWTSSVCTGAFILGAAGLLQGVRATTHWASRDHLAQVGATCVPERYVQHGKIITAAGVSAGIDMALLLAANLAGEEWAQATQLALEYDPQPPFDTGAFDKAPDNVRDLVRTLMRARAEQNHAMQASRITTTSEGGLQS
ncbi:MAG: DJ-1/PfpI family protein [Chloroflexales bacterium]|nr:DJ-1/PfpI family protein [Chloroflexales bacterium]